MVRSAWRHAANTRFYEHDKVVTGSDAGDGTVRYADALFFGLNAGVWCEAQEYPDWVEKTFDQQMPWSN